MTITTQAFNFTPDAFELACMQRVANSQDWDASMDLAFWNIAYDESKKAWVKLPPYHQYFTPLDHAIHNARVWNGQGGYSPYGIWHLKFTNILLTDDLWQSLNHGHLDPYGYVMELYDRHFDPEEAALLFKIADQELYVRQMEVIEEEAKNILHRMEVPTHD